jgi:hypothetical protein
VIPPANPPVVHIINLEQKYNTSVCRLVERGIRTEIQAGGIEQHGSKYRPIAFVLRDWAAEKRVHVARSFPVECRKGSSISAPTDSFCTSWDGSSTGEGRSQIARDTYTLPQTFLSHGVCATESLQGESQARIPEKCIVVCDKRRQGNRRDRTRRPSALKEKRC